MFDNVHYNFRFQSLEILSKFFWKIVFETQITVETLWEPGEKLRAGKISEILLKKMLKPGNFAETGLLLGTHAFWPSLFVELLPLNAARLSQSFVTAQYCSVWTVVLCCSPARFYWVWFPVRVRARLRGPSVEPPSQLPVPFDPK